MAGPQRSRAAPEELAILVVENNQPDIRMLVVLDEVARDRAGRPYGNGQCAYERDDEHEQFAHELLPLLVE